MLPPALQYGRNQILENAFSDRGPGGGGGAGSSGRGGKGGGGGGGWNGRGGGRGRQSVLSSLGPSLPALGLQKPGLFDLVALIGGAPCQSLALTHASTHTRSLHPLPSPANAPQVAAPTTSFQAADSSATSATGCCRGCWWPCASWWVIEIAHTRVLRISSPCALEHMPGARCSICPPCFFPHAL